MCVHRNAVFVDMTNWSHHAKYQDNDELALLRHKRSFMHKIVCLANIQNMVRKKLRKKKPTSLNSC